MGHFTYTCSVSGLPIVGGDSVRFMALVRSPFTKDGGLISSINDLWDPLGLPIKAIYNDYGTVEKVEQGPLKDLFFECLRTFSFERGPGDNVCHDLGVEKNMAEVRWLDALRSGSILIKHPGIESLDSEVQEFMGKGVDVRIPTRKSVEEAILQEGHKISHQGYTEAGYLVDELKPGYIRVRTVTQEPLEVLKLEAFAKVLMAGTGGYGGWGSELLVVPKPATFGQSTSPLRVRSIGQKETKDAEYYSVCQAMIREDVWQALVDYDKVYNLKTLRERVAHQKRRRVPLCMTGIKSSSDFKDCWDKVPVDDLAEMAMVEVVLMHLGKMWLPGSACGPQDPNVEDHRWFHSRILSIVEAQTRSDG